MEDIKKQLIDTVTDLAKFMGLPSLYSFLKVAFNEWKQYLVRVQFRCNFTLNHEQFTNTLK